MIISVSNFNGNCNAIFVGNSVSDKISGPDQDLIKSQHVAQNIYY
jgi:hypothetical protein